jgi:hypothetical protein
LAIGASHPHHGPEESTSFGPQKGDKNSEALVRAENESIYTDGSYLSLTGGTWHREDSPFEARWIMQMLAKHADFKP